MRMIWPILRRRTGKATLSIGGSACRPAITQTMAAAQRRDVMLDGREVLHINGALSAGQKLGVDFATGAVTLDGASISKAASMWTEAIFRRAFRPGVHGLTSDDGGSLTARWRCEWA